MMLDVTTQTENWGNSELIAMKYENNNVKMENENGKGKLMDIKVWFDPFFYRYRVVLSEQSMERSFSLDVRDGSLSFPRIMP